MQSSIIPATLDGLADQINEEHRQVERNGQSMLHHAATAGDLLIEAKKQCPHGTWSGWLADNFQGSMRTAQAYMRVAREWSELGSNTQRVAHLSYRDALKELADPRDESEPEIEQPEASEPEPEPEPEYLYEGSDDIAEFRSAPTKRNRIQATPPSHPCETCGEIHDRPMWHCSGCDEHYERTQRFCPDCNPPKPTVETDLPYEFELLKDARYTLEEARDVLGADTSAGGMVTGLIRNLDDIVKNIRRWRGEQV